MRYEAQYRRRDGSLFWMESVVNLVQWDAAPAIQTTVIDITKQREAEDQLRHAQKMQAVGRLTGGIAHDFNNLLSVVLGNLELLEEGIHDTDSHAEAVQSAMGAVRRGARLTEQLLSFSRQKSLRPRVVNLAAFATEMSDMLKHTLGEIFDIDLVVEKELWKTFVDVDELQNALLNLALNARDAMAKGGKLTIELGNRRVESDESRMDAKISSGDYVFLSVRDRGTGMPARVIEHAFDPFFTTKEVGDGSGLGLSMVYGFAKQSKGHVEIESQVGRGTTVKLYLPRRKEEAPLSATETIPRQSPPEGKGEVVLVVEDEEEVRKLAIDFLTRLGYRPIAAEDGPAALAVLADTHNVELLFTDIVLRGGLTGFELAREARQHFPDLKVLYTSGWADSSAFDQSGETDESVECLRKPYSRASLAQKICAALDRREH